VIPGIATHEYLNPWFGILGNGHTTIMTTSDAICAVIDHAKIHGDKDTPEYEGAILAIVAGDTPEWVNDYARTLRNTCDSCDEVRETNEPEIVDGLCGYCRT
jgi:hypothetical protein